MATPLDGPPALLIQVELPSEVSLTDSISWRTFLSTGWPYRRFSRTAVSGGEPRLGDQARGTGDHRGSSVALARPSPDLSDLAIDQPCAPGRPSLSPSSRILNGRCWLPLPP
jgi:hypothetical protein